jgi:hypothetical protein
MLTMRAMPRADRKISRASLPFPCDGIDFC